MKKTYKILIFTLISLFLLMVPIGVWIRYVDTLKSGVEVQRVVSGYDPIDVLKGNYVRVSYNNDEDIFLYAEDEDENAYIEFDEEGNIKNVSTNKPIGSYYLKCELYNLYGTEPQGEEKVYGSKTNTSIGKRIANPFPTKYYTNEEKAQELEKSLRDGQDYIIKIRVKNNIAIITDIEP